MVVVANKLQFKSKTTLTEYSKKLKRYNLNLLIEGKRGKETDPEIEAATQSLMGLDSVAPPSGMDSMHDTSRLVPGPPIGSSVTAADQGVTTVGQTMVPGEIPAKAVASAQDGSKKKMTFVVPKGQLRFILTERKRNFRCEQQFGFLKNRLSQGDVPFAFALFQRERTLRLFFRRITPDFLAAYLLGF